MSNQNFNENQKEDFKEVFKEMKLSFKESERIKGGDNPDEPAWICLSTDCNPACNTSCVSCTLCDTGGAFACEDCGVGKGY